MSVQVREHKEQRASPPLNQCPACSEDFASLAAFDEHVQSAPSDPRFACMQVSEMRQEGWTQNAYGRWTTSKLAAKAEQLAEHFKRGQIAYETECSAETPGEAAA